MPNSSEYNRKEALIVNFVGFKLIVFQILANLDTRRLELAEFRGFKLVNSVSISRLLPKFPRIRQVINFKSMKIGNQCLLVIIFA